MDETEQIKAKTRLESYREMLTQQQYKTLRGQIRAGEAAAAMKGLDKLLIRYSRESQ